MMVHRSHASSLSACLSLCLSEEGEGGLSPGHLQSLISQIPQALARHVRREQQSIGVAGANHSSQTYLMPWGTVHLGVQYLPRCVGSGLCWLW